MLGTDKTQQVGMYSVLGVQNLVFMIGDISCRYCGCIAMPVLSSGVAITIFVV